MTSDSHPAAAADLDDLVGRYIRHASKGSGEGGTYAASARAVLDQFTRWCSSSGTTLEQLNDPQNGPTAMRHYAARLSRRVDGGGLSASSARTYYATLSAFLTFCVNDGVLDRNPAKSERAKEMLPDDDQRSEQQYWGPFARQRLLWHVDQEADRAVDEHGFAALEAVRDRALVYVLAFSGCRGAEILRVSRDDRPGRQGLTWERVDLDGPTLTVLGKAQEWEEAPLLSQAHAPVERLESILRPASDEWPLFPSLHTPTLYRVARERLPDAVASSHQDLDIDEALEDATGALDVLDLFREFDVAPPSLTVDGGRRVLKRLSEDAGIDVNGEYLKLHGARRQLGDDLWSEDRGMAQDALRHRSLETTRAAYSKRRTGELAERASDVVDGSSAGVLGDDRADVGDESDRDDGHS